MVWKVPHLIWISVSLAIAAVALAVALAGDVSEALVRSVVGVLGAVGCCEVILYSAGYTSRLDPLVPLRIRLRTPKLKKILIGLLIFVAGTSIYNMLLYLTSAIDRAVLAAISALITYAVARGLSWALSAGLSTRVVAIIVAVATFMVLSSDGDFKYIENLLKLLEEVTRYAF
jgi:hypothetical protein